MFEKHENHNIIRSIPSVFDRLRCHLGLLYMVPLSWSASPIYVYYIYDWRPCFGVKFQSTLLLQLLYNSMANTHLSLLCQGMKTKKLTGVRISVCRLLTSFDSTKCLKIIFNVHRNWLLIK